MNAPPAASHPGRYTRRAALAGALALALSSCAATGATQSGELLIVGGGLRAENEEVFRAFTRGAGERIAVLPTASGVPEESGPGTVQDLSRYAEPDQSVELVEILATTPERAADPAYLRAIERAGAAWFTGGVQSRILDVFRPGGSDSPAYGAVRDLLERGGRVGGTSAGAAMMCDPMIAGGSSRDALLHGLGDDGFEMEPGMGFFPYGVVDQHFLRRGRIGRLVVALELSGFDLGWGVSDNCALHVDLATDEGRPLGERAVLMVDVRETERRGASRLGVGVSLLSSGDVVDLATGEVLPAEDKAPVAPGVAVETEVQSDLQPFGRDAVTLLLEGLSADPEHQRSATAEGISLAVRADARTRFLSQDASLDGFTVIGAILDIRIDEQAAAAAEAARAADRP